MRFIERKKNYRHLVIVIVLLFSSFLLTACGATDVKHTSGERHQITIDFIKMMDEDPQLRHLMEESISLAAVNNPDKKTNPVRSLDEYYDFLDWSATCMPWNILDGQDNTDLYRSIDQSLDYFYYLLDQPLPELAGKGYYYPCLEYHEPIATWCKQYASEWGEFLSTKESWNDEYYKLACKDEAFGMSKGWYADTNIWGSFNEWFSRHLVDENQRVISDADIVSPADSTPQGIWEIDENSQIDMGVQLKSSRFYSVEQIIGEDSEYETCFANGTMTHTFLDVNDYHRYHFPIDGTILEVRKIPGLDAVGGLVAWSKEENKYILYDENPGWQSIETRDCLIMDTEYGLVAILPIAMSQVSSCNWEDSVQVGAMVEKGDPMGYFLFGGSDIVMIFQDSVSLELASKEHVLMGEPYAEVTIE
jgi:phosphatidylserine decarboxylase precursor